MNKKLGFVYVTLFSLAWAVQTILNKVAVDRGVDPLSFAYQTLFLGVLMLGVYMIFLKRKDFVKIEIKPLSKMALVGIIGSGISTLLTFYGLKYSTSINYGFIFKSSVIFSVLLAFLFLGEKLGLKKIFYVILLLIGVYFVSTNGVLVYPRVGDLIILAAGFASASANIIARPLLRTYSPELMTLVRMFFGGLIILMFGPFFVADFFVFTDFWLVFFRSLMLFLTLLFMNKTIRVTNISYMSMMSTMFSVFVLILGYFVLGESFGLWQALGGIVIILSVLMIQRERGMEV